MYIYWSNKIAIDYDGLSRVQGLVVAPEKEGKDPFQPAVDGDTVTVIFPFSDSEGTEVEMEKDIVLVKSTDSSPIVNSGAYLFAYEGSVYGQIAGESGNSEIKGVIFKAVKSGSECVPENNPGDIVLVITDCVDGEVDTPEIF